MEIHILGPRLKAARNAHKLTQEYVAKKVDCKASYISMIEKAKVKSLSDRLLRKLSALLVELENQPIDGVKADVIPITAAVKNAEQYHPGPEFQDSVN